MIARTARVAVLLLAALSCRLSATPQVMPPSDTEIVLTRTFSAPRERVFAALTRPDQIAQWMRSTGMTLVDCEVDLRVGGALRYVFARAGGRRLEVRGIFRVVEAPRRIVYLESYDFSPLEVLVTTALDAAGESTRFTQTLQYATKAERDEDYDGVVTSSAEAHDGLERYLKRKAGGD